MKKLTSFLSLLLVFISSHADQVAYISGSDEVRFHDVKLLSDDTVLVAGQANGLGWVPNGVVIQEMPAAGINSAADQQIAFLAQFNADMSELISVVHFPQGTVRDVFRIRSTEVPGQTTGSLFISGSRDTSGWQGTGYYLARLNNDFITGLPTGLTWSYDVVAEPRQAGGRQGESAYKTIQPWDVNSKGEIIFGRGSEYDFGWAVIHKLDNQGALTTVENWPIHWQPTAGECYTAASNCTETPTHSGIVLKAGRIGSLRSRSVSDHESINQDGNGNDRQGSMPDDYYFSTACEIGNCPSSAPGYTGYRTSDKPTQRLGGISIDRRTGDVYFGYSTQSRLPGGNPDFEPALVGMDSDGSLKWWQRMYRETQQNSPPDQYVDAVEIDYAQNQLVVLGRTHGNAVDNFFSGNDINANPSAHGFQNRFTGTSGNIHISWLGKFATTDGTLTASTYVAEFQNGGAGTNGLMTDPNLNQFPNPNSGWPDLNTTHCRNEIHVGLSGEVGLMCTGRRIITTTDAQHGMYPIGSGESKWSQFARVYTPNLSSVLYSTLVTGEWDGSSANEPNNTVLNGLFIKGNFLLVAGHHITDDSGVAEGAAIRTQNTPAWAAATPDGETALWARLQFNNPSSNQSDLIFADGFEP